MTTASSSLSWASSSARYNVGSFKSPMASFTGSLYGLAGCPSSYDVLSTPDDDYADTRDNKFGVNNMGISDHSLLLMNPSTYSTPFTSPLTIVTTSASTCSCVLSTTSRGHDYNWFDDTSDLRLPRHHRPRSQPPQSSSASELLCLRQSFL